MKDVPLKKVVDFLDKYCKKSQYADFDGSYNG